MKSNYYMLRPVEDLVPTIEDIRRASLRYCSTPMAELSCYPLENDKGKYSGVFLLCFSDGITWNITYKNKCIENECRNPEGWESRVVTAQRMFDKSGRLWMTVKKGRESK